MVQGLLLSDIVELKKTATITASAIYDGPKQDDNGLKEFLEGKERTFRRYDEEITSIGRRDPAIIDLWSPRMLQICTHLRELKTQISHWRRLQFDWVKVSTAMGWLIAYNQAAQELIELHTPEEKGEEDQDWNQG